MQHTQYLLDTTTFTRLGETLSGHVSVNALTRATTGLPEQKGQEFAWSLQGMVDSVGRRFINLRVSGSLLLECQRCLTPVSFDVNASNTLEVVNTEAELELDEDDVEGPDRVLSTQRLNVLELVEDEIILNLPYVARHERCPSLHESLTNNDEPDFVAEKPNPFAVLGKLKKS